MTDMENVIKELEVRIISDTDKGYKTIEIPVNEAEDILTLLKEQEAVEPYIAGSGESFETAETWWYECGNCNKPIDPNDKFCRYCGRRVKWE